MEDLANGEIVIMQHPSHFSRWNGALGVVIGLRCSRKALDLNTNRNILLDGYRVRVLDTDGIELICEPHQLRKLHDFGESGSTRQGIELESPEAETVD
mgnify:CR=1 FL=1